MVPSQGFHQNELGPYKIGEIYSSFGLGHIGSFYKKIRLYSVLVSASALSLSWAAVEKSELPPLLWVRFSTLLCLTWKKVLRFLNPILQFYVKKGRPHFGKSNGDAGIVNLCFFLVAVLRIHGGCFYSL